VRPADVAPTAHAGEGVPRVALLDADATGAVAIRLNGTDVVVPDGTAESHLSMVLRAVASL
jgi:hypothetical protein